MTQTHPTEEDHFWSRVEKTFVSQEGCWEWTGPRRPDGTAYALFYGRMQTIRRIAYQIAHGPIKGGHVHPICSNEACVNPDHLRWSQHSGRKLSADQIRAIKSSDKSYRALAEEHGVSFSTIRAVKKGWTYRD